MSKHGTLEQRVNRLAQRKPIHSIVVDDDIIVEGMTLRQHYAGLAMQAFISGVEARSMRRCVQDSVSIADQLIRALEDSEGTEDV